jgi:hypothetical protein
MAAMRRICSINISAFAAPRLITHPDAAVDQRIVHDMSLLFD